MIGANLPVSISVKSESGNFEYIELVADDHEVTINCCDAGGSVLVAHQLYVRENPELLNLVSRGPFDVLWDGDMLMSLIAEVDESERPEPALNVWRFVQWEPDTEPDFTNITTRALKA
jgi:hypothetical protein